MTAWILLFVAASASVIESSVGAENILGSELLPCCNNCGYSRQGLCTTDDSDQGTHVVCAILTDEFLTFAKSKGNDLSTPHPEMQFPGLIGGDKWCLCALRWKEAFEAGEAPPVYPNATDARATKYVTREALESLAIFA